MKKRKNVWVGICVFVLAVMMFALPAQAKVLYAKTTSLVDVTKAEKVEGKWVKKKGGYKFYLKNKNTYPKRKWINVKGEIYYVNGTGHRVSGWIKYRNNLYFMRKSGRLNKGWRKEGRNQYYFTANGTAAKGMVKIGGVTYYFKPSNCVMCKGWVKIGKYWYYFRRKDGCMLTSCWIKTGNKHYYVGKTGVRAMGSGWLTVGKNKYYLKADGSRVTGELYIGNKGYYFNSNGVYNPSVYVPPKVDAQNQKMVALTFDDGPGPYTNSLLDCLQANGAKATFFMVGSSVPSYPSAVKRMVNLGCELGNHSYNHSNFNRLSWDSMRWQVSQTSSNIYNACGKYPTLMRLPGGNGYNNSTVLAAIGLPSVFWSIDTRDWDSAHRSNVQLTINEVLNHVQSGDIILMHDIHYTSVQAAKTIIPALRQRGYQLVTVSELAKYRGKTTMQKGRTYFNFR